MEIGEYFFSVDDHFFQQPFLVWSTNFFIKKKRIYFYEMSVLFDTGELNAYVYDGGELYRRKYVRTEGKERTTTITLADGKLLPCIATRG